IASWNGQWSGEGRNYVIVRNVPSETVAKWGRMSWRHGWGDGWCACVTARVMEKGERKPKSDGFCGYDWMVNNIIRWGTTQCQCDFRPMSGAQADVYGGGEWERCSHCGTVKQVVGGAA